MILKLDGLDEVSDPDERKRVVDDIHRLSNDHRQARIIVTSRVVGYEPERLRDAGFQHYMLHELDEDQIERFLDRWHAEAFDDVNDAAAKHEQLTEAIADSTAIAELAGNPLMLTMMAIVNRHRELPRKRAALYEQCSQLLLHHWKHDEYADRYPQLGREFDQEAKADLLRRIASAMQLLPEGFSANIVGRRALRQLIEGFLRDELRLGDKAAGAADAVIDQLREQSYIICFLGSNSYGFVHKTFLEYFCASSYVHRFEKERLLSDAELESLFRAHCRDDQWHEVLRLICGQIDDNITAKIIPAVLDQKPRQGHGAEDLHNPWIRFSTAGHWNGKDPLPALLLAVRCLGEMRAPYRHETLGQLIQDRLLAVATRIRVDEFADEREWLDQLTAAACELGYRWPCRDRFCFEITAILRKMPKLRDLAMESLVQCLGSTSANRAVLSSLLESYMAKRSLVMREGLCVELAKHWPDEVTRELLTTRAVEDDRQFVRDRNSVSV